MLTTSSLVPVNAIVITCTRSYSFNSSIHNELKIIINSLKETFRVIL